MIRQLMTFLLTLAVSSGSLLGQDSDADAAAKALENLASAYRSHPGATVRSTLQVSVLQDDLSGNSDTRSADFTFAGSRNAIVKINGFDMRLSGGQVWATHGSNDEAFVQTEDAGSPYYTLLNAFQDMPWIHLALIFGEDDVDDLVMQLHPRAPWLRPTKLQKRMVDGVEHDCIMFTSDHSSLELVVDPASGLLESAKLVISSGQLVEAGAEVSFIYDFQYEFPKKPLEKEFFVLDPGDRKKVDSLAALVREDSPRTSDLVGMVVQPFELPTSDGAVISSADHQGKVMVIDFCAAWCGPCAKLLPELQKLSDWIEAEQLPAVVLPVHTWFKQDDPERQDSIAASFLRDHGLKIPMGLDRDSSLSQQMGVSGIPQTFVVRSDGIVWSVHQGASEDQLKMLKDDVLAAIDVVEADQEQKDMGDF